MWFSIHPNSFCAHGWTPKAHGEKGVSSLLSNPTFKSFMPLSCAYAGMSKFFMTRIDTNLENENNFVEIAIINGIVIVGDYQNISFKEKTRIEK